MGSHFNWMTHLCSNFAKAPCSFQTLCLLQQKGLSRFEVCIIKRVTRKLPCQKCSVDPQIELNHKCQSQDEDASAVESLHFLSHTHIWSEHYSKTGKVLFEKALQFLVGTNKRQEHWRECKVNKESHLKQRRHLQRDLYFLEEIPVHAKHKVKNVKYIWNKRFSRYIHEKRMRREKCVKIFDEDKCRESEIKK